MRCCTGPSARSFALMAYDSATSQLLLFGGSNASGVAQNDTWSWTGTAWAQLFPATSPPARGSATLAYDAATSQMVLFGGWHHFRQRHMDLGRRQLGPSIPGYQPCRS